MTTSNLASSSVPIHIGLASLESLVVTDDDPKKVAGDILDEELWSDVVPAHFRQLKKSGR